MIIQIRNVMGAVFANTVISEEEFKDDAVVLERVRYITAILDKRTEDKEK
jgi:hypothetical protein